MVDSGPDGAHLKTVLDLLWQCREDCHALALRLVESLDPPSWLLLAAWDAAASLGSVSGRVHVDDHGTVVISDAWGQDLMRVRVLQAARFDDVPMLIRFRGTPYGVVAPDHAASVPQERLVHDPVGLLLALELIRDHIDSALLLPLALRDKEIARMASVAGVTDTHLRRLAAWFPQIERYLPGGWA